MSVLDAYVLTGPGLDAEALAERLRERGVHAAWGDAPSPCRVLLHVGPTDAAPGAAHLNVGADATWLPAGLDAEERDDRISDCVLSLLDLADPERLVHPAHLARTVADVRRFAAEHPEPDALLRITAVIERAVDRGAPIHNAGSTAGCAMVYEAAVDALLAHLDEDLPPLARAIAEELRSTREAPAEPDRSWTLRDAFDRVLLAFHTAQGMESMDITFESLALAGRSMSPSLLYDIIGLAIARGAPVFNAGGHEGCARIYLRTAVGILDRLDPDPETASRSEVLAQESLSELVAGAEARLADNATELAWDLRNAFDGIVDVAAEERGWQHDA